MWYVSYGFKENPLKITPEPERLVGYESEAKKLLAAMESGDMVALTGLTGSGKTTLVKHLAKSTAGSHKHIYYDCSLVPASEFSMTKLLTKPWFFGLLKQKIGPKDRAIFFCDEVQKLGPDKAEEIKAHFDAGILHSIVLTTINEMNIVDSMKSRISETISLPELSEENLVRIVKDRFKGGIQPFTENALRKLAHKSNMNPRQMLLNAERICKTLHTTHNKEGTITEELIDLHLTAVTKENTNSQQKPAHLSPVTVMTKPLELAQNQPAIEGPAEKLQEKLSPLQWAIVKAISGSIQPVTYEELEVAIGKDKGTIAKQLSRLALISDTELMLRKGITEPIIIKKSRDGRPVFDLTDSVRFILAKQ